MHIRYLHNWISCSHITPQQQHSKRNSTQNETEQERNTSHSSFCLCWWHVSDTWSNAECQTHRQILFTSNSQTFSLPVWKWFAKLTIFISSFRLNFKVCQVVRELSRKGIKIMQNTVGKFLKMLMTTLRCVIYHVVAAQNVYSKGILTSSYLWLILCSLDKYKCITNTIENVSVD